MQEQRFIGVYSSSEMPSTLGASHRPMVRRKRLWFVWETDDGKYRVQPLNAIHEPMAEPRFISAREFEKRFTLEAECFAAPTDCMPERVEAPGDSEAEADAPGKIARPSSAPEKRSVALRADDPNLLRLWLKEEAPAASVQEGCLTPAQEAEMTRLLDCAFLNSSQEAMTLQSTRPARVSSPGMGESLERDTEQALRADFALALLHLKQNRREEGVAGLECMLARESAPFAGAALLFSEFGLSLRRLGLINQALLAHRRALEFSPDDERVHFNLARGYHDLNEFGMARKHLEQAVKISPNFTLARQFLGFLKTKEPEALPSAKTR